MPLLNNKNILVLSPQTWGDMYISKHHYALELARRGNRVCFLNPPDQSKTGKAYIRVEQSPVEKNLFIIHHRPWFPFILKFHALPLFQWLMKGHVKKVLRKAGMKPDIIWSFDLGNMYPFRNFSGSVLKIFHPVDEPLNKPAIDAAKGSHVIFSVTKEILDKYKWYGIPLHLVNHGVADKFVNCFNTNYTPSQPLRTGISGNFMRPDLDRETFLKIISENKNVQFHCWGSYEERQANIGGGGGTDTANFINALRQSPNVILYGAVVPEKLAEQMQAMDLFLICYDINKDQSRGTNYHKIMEYLATGRVVVSNNVTAYDQAPELVQMSPERDSNQSLPALFKKVTGAIDKYNEPAAIQKRHAFAKENTYVRQLEKIDGILDNITGNK